MDTVRRCQDHVIFEVWLLHTNDTYDGRRIVFAPHITIGAKSADRCLSIHLHDEAKRKAVVAHVGRHKTNTRS